MKYRTKLYLLFLTISVISIISSLTIIVMESRNAVFSEIQSKTIIVSSAAALQINPEIVKQIQTIEDQETKGYKQLAEILRRVRDVNRRKDIYIKYLYIIRPDPIDPQKFTFVVDAEEQKIDFSLVGEADPAATKDFLYEHLDQPYSYDEMVKDQWGTWLTGYYPIHDESGNYVATIGASISAARVNEALNRLVVYAASAFIFSLIIAMLFATFLARHESRALEKLKRATQEIAKGNFEYQVELKANDEFNILANSLNHMAEELQEKERMKMGFSRYVSKYVLDRIIEEKGSARLEGEKRRITVLFSDIRGFTQIAESMPPEEVVRLLNEYFKEMLEVIFKYNGTLDKLLGDGIMAAFGAPMDDPEQEKNAVRAAVEMVQKSIVLKEKWKSEGKPEIDVGISVHTGEAIVGNVGTEERLEYTAIGDTVNISARLQEVSKTMQFPIIVSESTFMAIQTDFKYKDLGDVMLSGRKQPIKAFAILT